MITDELLARSRADEMHGAADKQHYLGYRRALADAARCRYRGDYTGERQWFAQIANLFLLTREKLARELGYRDGYKQALVDIAADILQSSDEHARQQLEHYCAVEQATERKEVS